MTMNESVALVTGGSRGIGRAICLELARQGAAVAVNYAGNEQAAQETVEACRALGVQAEAFQADVSDPAACESLIAQVKERFGRLDILVNNAGVTRDGLLMTAKAEDFDKVLDTNLKGAYFCMKAAAKELASRNITVNAVAPGFIETDMTAVLSEKAKTAMLATIPMAAPGQPEDVARAAAFFARPESAYITGQVLCVDGGMAV